MGAGLVTEPTPAAVVAAAAAVAEAEADDIGDTEDDDS